MPRILQVSDLHFGRLGRPEQVDALTKVFSSEREKLDAIVVAGDLTQRTRTHEFTQARKFLYAASTHAPVLVVPGNHDVAWWMAPMGLGVRSTMYSRYREFVRPELEAVLHVPGATFVGLNSAQGVQPHTLTMRPRDLATVGALRESQWDRARRDFAAAPAGDVKVLVFHHNVLRGRISNRWGLANRARGIERTAATGADLVLNGHDHEARIEQVTAGGRRFVVSTTNTLTDRVRGGAPSQFHIIDADVRAITVTPWVWSEEAQRFAPAAPVAFTRKDS